MGVSIGHIIFLFLSVAHLILFAWMIDNGAARSIGTFTLSLTALGLVYDNAMLACGHWLFCGAQSDSSVFKRLEWASHVRTTRIEALI